MSEHKTGLIVEGGGMKCAYSAGVLDAFIDQNLTFDYCAGVSAGAANVASFMAHQRDRNRRFYCKHVTDPRYISIQNFLRTGSLFGLHYIYGDLTNEGGGDPLDYDALMANPAQLSFPVTDAASGQAVYLGKKDVIRNHYESIMATCCLPVMCKPIEYNGKMYYDGGVSDSIPVARALADGCERLVVILSKPSGFRKPPEKHRILYRMALRKYPHMIEALDKRHENYNASLDLLETLVERGKAIVFRPDGTVKMSTYTTDPNVMAQLYENGLKDGIREEKTVHDFLQL